MYALFYRFNDLVNIIAGNLVNTITGNLVNTITGNLVNTIFGNFVNTIIGNLVNILTVISIIRSCSVFPPFGLFLGAVGRGGVLGVALVGAQASFKAAGRATRRR